MSLAGGKEKSHEPIEPLKGQRQKSAELDQELQRLIQEEQKMAREVETKTPPLDAEELVRFSRDLPRLIQQTLSKMDASQVYQSFRLPGRDYVVHDHREGKQEGTGEKDLGREIARESKKSIKELMIQEGKLFPVKEKSYENYLADPVGRMGVSPEQQASQERVLKLLTLFEKLLLQRFERGEELTKLLKEGDPSFLEKTAKQWRDFFARFFRRTVKRTVSQEELHSILYRGFVAKDVKGTVISDLNLANGQIEKFARFKLQQRSQELESFLSQLKPGERLTSEQLRRFFAGELEYLAIRHGEGEAAWSPAPQKGKFLGSAQAEANVASDLGLQLGEQLKEKEKVFRRLGGGKKGLGGFAGGGEEGGAEGGVPQEQFIPWWQYGLRKKPIRWGLTAFLFIILVGILIGLSVLF